MKLPAVSTSKQIAAADFFVVPTATSVYCSCSSSLAHERRRIVHLAVTTHPSAAWTAQQFRDAFPWDQAPRYLIHDRDLAFQALIGTVKAMGIEDVRTAPRSPSQNAYVERFIGSVRRECLDHVIVLNAAGLHTILKSYCNSPRTPWWHEQLPGPSCLFADDMPFQWSNHSSRGILPCYRRAVVRVLPEVSSWIRRSITSIACSSAWHWSP